MGTERGSKPIKSTCVKVRMDPEVKREAELILGELGISTSGAIDMFFRQVILRRGLPFDVALAPVNMRKDDLRKLDKLLEQGYHDLMTECVTVREGVTYSDIAAQELDGIRTLGRTDEEDDYQVDMWRRLQKHIRRVAMSGGFAGTLLMREPWRERRIRMTSFSGYCVFFRETEEGDYQVARIIYFGIPSINRIWDLGAEKS